MKMMSNVKRKNDILVLIILNKIYDNTYFVISPLINGLQNESISLTFRKFEQ